MLFLRLRPLEMLFSPCSGLSKPRTPRCPPLVSPPGVLAAASSSPAHLTRRPWQQTPQHPHSFRNATSFSRHGRRKREHTPGGGSCWRPLD